MSSKADVVFYGGQAGGGKTHAILMECLRHVHNSLYRALVFRRNTTQILCPGGLWDASQELYRALGGKPNKTLLEWDFSSGAKVKFAHLEHEDTVYNYQGSEMALICFDELISFTSKQFVYMLSRNRSMSGIHPYVRATCNPDPDHWARKWLAWWIDKDTGLPVKERAGIVRWFIIRDDVPVWADAKETLELDYPGCLPKSFTFIPASVHDNQILLRKNPQYLANLDALSIVDRGRLRDGNWNIRESAGMFFRREWFEVIDRLPCAIVKEVRYWDRASTEESSSKKDTSFTAGVKMGMDHSGLIYILDMEKFRGSPLQVSNMIKDTAMRDGRSCLVGIEQDPGQAGVVEAQSHVRNLAGYNVFVNKVHESKGTRAKPLSVQAEQGNVKILRGSWNHEFLRVYEGFDGTSKCMADEVDAGSGGLLVLTARRNVGTW